MSNRNSTQQNWTSWHHLLHKEILSKKTLIPKGANILIAVSGGQDSMALLNLINDLKKQHNWSINVWHGDHQWHKKSSIYAHELKNYCEKKNITFYSDKAEKEKILTEDKARDWRYQKLCERGRNLLTFEKQKKFYLLTGHTSTDNAETFILNLARGSNYAGLSNIKSKRLLDNQLFLIRPILIFSRHDTKKICEMLNIPIWEDPTNADLKIKRNFVRHKIIPSLESIYPQCSERINNFTQIMNSYKAERNDLTELAYLYCKDPKGIRRDLFKSMGLEARCTILNKFLLDFGSKQLSSKNLSFLSYLIIEKDKGQLDLLKDLKIIWNHDYINFEKH